MPGKHNAFRTRPARINGVVVGGTEHMILLALRGPGGMTSDQVYERFAGGGTSGALHRLKVAGYVAMPGNGQKGKPIRLTEAGRSAVAPDGPLARSKTLINYCHL